MHIDSSKAGLTSSRSTAASGESAPVIRTKVSFSEVFSNSGTFSEIMSGVFAALDPAGHAMNEGTEVEPSTATLKTTDEETKDTGPSEAVEIVDENGEDIESVEPIAVSDENALSTAHETDIEERGLHFERASGEYALDAEQSIGWDVHSVNEGTPFDEVRPSVVSAGGTTTAEIHSYEGVRDEETSVPVGTVEQSEIFRAEGSEVGEGGENFPSGARLERGTELGDQYTARGEEDLFTARPNIDTETRAVDSSGKLPHEEHLGTGAAQRDTVDVIRSPRTGDPERVQFSEFSLRQSSSSELDRAYFASDLPAPQEKVRQTDTETRPANVREEKSVLIPAGNSETDKLSEFPPRLERTDRGDPLSSVAAEKPSLNVAPIQHSKTEPGWNGDNSLRHDPLNRPLDLPSANTAVGKSDAEILEFAKPEVQRNASLSQRDRLKLEIVSNLGSAEAPRTKFRPEAAQLPPRDAVTRSVFTEGASEIGQGTVRQSDHSKAAVDRSTEGKGAILGLDANPSRSSTSSINATEVVSRNEAPTTRHTEATADTTTVRELRNTMSGAVDNQIRSVSLATARLDISSKGYSGEVSELILSNRHSIDVGSPTSKLDNSRNDIPMAIRTVEAQTIATSAMPLVAKNISVEATPAQPFDSVQAVKLQPTQFQTTVEAGEQARFHERLTHYATFSAAPKTKRPQISHEVQPSQVKTDRNSKASMPGPITLNADNPASASFASEMLGIQGQSDLVLGRGRDQGPFSTTTSAPHSPAMVRDVVQQIAPVVRSVSNEYTELTLSPDELGKVRMRMTGQDGQIMLQVVAERPETQDLMRRHIDIVERAFRDLGYSDIAFEFSSSGQQMQQGDSGSPTTETVQPSEQVPEDVPLKPEPMALGMTRVDIRV